MAQQTDQKVHEELLNEGYSQSSRDPTRYFKPDGNGGYTNVDTDGRWVRNNETGQWEKR
ncbi:hypothetical protein [Spirosoma sp. KNUC1025]|uniref:hypothetical protein n=1 Tax=Spirosoma sp. KNUC1025 TaxID=2894082 RepID=UPI003869165D|nr:hypothetical protein LN737_01225 [Spirosoma sp. KNUC1025]